MTKSTFCMCTSICLARLSPLAPAPIRTNYPEVTRLAQRGIQGTRAARLCVRTHLSWLQVQIPDTRATTVHWPYMSMKKRRPIFVAPTACLAIYTLHSHYVKTDFGRSRIHAPTEGLWIPCRIAASSSRFAEVGNPQTEMAKQFASRRIV